MSSTPSKSRFGGRPPASAASSDNRVHSSRGGVGRQSGTGEIQVREPSITARTRPGPGGQRRIERGDLRAARIDLQTEQVVPQHGVDRVTRCEVVLLHAQTNQQVEALDQEVTTAAARIEDAQVGRHARPALEAAGGRPPGPRRLLCFVSIPRLPHESQVGEVATAVRFQAHRFAQFLLARRGRGQLGPRRQNPARTPSANGVVQQKQHHVALGEELRHRRQLVGPDQEMVLRQEAGEQHPVPVLVGHLVDQAVDGLHAGIRIVPVSELAPVRSQAPPQVLIRRRHRQVRASVADREHAEHVAGAGLARAPRGLDGRGEPVAKVGG